MKKQINLRHLILIFFLSFVLSFSVTPLVGAGLGVSTQNDNYVVFSNAQFYSKDAGSSLLASIDTDNNAVTTEEWDTIFERHNVKKYSSLSALFPVSLQWQLSSLDEPIASVDFLGGNTIPDSSSNLSSVLLKSTASLDFSSAFSQPNSIIINDHVASRLLENSGKTDYSSLLGTQLLAKRGDQTKELVVGGVFSSDVDGVYLNHFYASNFESPCFFCTGVDAPFSYESLRVTLSWTYSINQMIFEDFAFYSSQYGFRLSFPNCPANQKTYQGVSATSLASSIRSETIGISIPCSILGILFAFLSCFLSFVLYDLTDIIYRKWYKLLFLSPILSLLCCIAWLRTPFVYGGFNVSVFSSLSSWLSLILFFLMESAFLFLFFWRRGKSGFSNKIKWEIDSCSIKI